MRSRAPLLWVYSGMSGMLLAWALVDGRVGPNGVAAKGTARPEPIGRSGLPSALAAQPASTLRSGQGRRAQTSSLTASLEASEAGTWSPQAGATAETEPGALPRLPSAASPGAAEAPSGGPVAGIDSKTIQAPFWLSGVRSLATSVDSKDGASTRANPAHATQPSPLLASLGLELSRLAHTVERAKADSADRRPPPTGLAAGRNLPELATQPFGLDRSAPQAGDPASGASDRRGSQRDVPGNSDPSAAEHDAQLAQGNLVRSGLPTATGPASRPNGQPLAVPSVPGPLDSGVDQLLANSEAQPPAAALLQPADRPSAQAVGGDSGATPQALAAEIARAPAPHTPAVPGQPGDPLLAGPLPANGREALLAYAPLEPHVGFCLAPRIAGASKESEVPALERLSGSVRFELVLTDARGKPLPNTPVELRTGEDQRLLLRLETGPQGELALALDPGRYRLNRTAVVDPHAGSEALANLGTRLTVRPGLRRVELEL